MAKFVKRPIEIEAEQLTEDTLIDTREGVMKAEAGDWLITGVQGEVYSCKNDIFRATYDPVDMTWEEWDKGS